MLTVCSDEYFSIILFLDFATAGSATIFVTDLNDNTPALDLPSDEITVFVNENAKVGHAIATVRATDFDEGYNGLVKFRLREPIKSSNFAIDSTTGELLILCKLKTFSKKKNDLSNPIGCWLRIFSFDA